MPSYSVRAINIGRFLLGEADKVLTLFTAERGIVRAVAKSARKPGTKMAGRSDTLCVNTLQLNSGKTFEIITQAECIDTFPEFRTNLQRMSYGLYYAELTQHFGQGLSEESITYFEYLYSSLVLQARSAHDPAWLCLEFELGLLDMLGYRPELTYCVSCREVLGDYNITTFNRDLGGVLCQGCTLSERAMALREKHTQDPSLRQSSWKEGSHITPLVWKNLVLAADRRCSNGDEHPSANPVVKPPIQQSVQAARKLMQGYIEHRAGRHMKALDILEQI